MLGFCWSGRELLNRRLNSHRFAMEFLILITTFCYVFNVAYSVDLTGCYPNPPQVIQEFFHGHGDIYSPGYQENAYPNDLQCVFSIRAPIGSRIYLSFVDLDIDPFDLCMKDKLVIHEGPDTRGPAHGVFCGTQRPNDIVSQGNAVTLVFASDFLTGRKGFHIRYEVTQYYVLCADRIMCRNRNCYNFIQKCDGVDNCGDGSDEENCNRPLPQATCGVTEIQPFESEGMDRIIGGREAKQHSWPWQADLQLDMFQPNGHMCGGTLINAEWVLTAGHCFQGNGRAIEWRIHLGSHRKFDVDMGEHVRYAKRIIIYPGYTGDEELQQGHLDMANDIALVKLNAPVTFSTGVRPACLPRQGEELQTGKACMATGWGMTRGTGSYDVLKQVQLDIQEGKKCLNDMIAFTPKSMICVRSDKGFEDVCHGDSGGPLVCKTGNTWYVMGATSYGTVTNYMGGACALPGAHTVYTKVSDKITWINKMIQTYTD